jgi:hypothetical protein
LLLRLRMDCVRVSSLRGIGITNIEGIRALGGVDTGFDLSAGALPLLHIAGHY